MWIHIHSFEELKAFKKYMTKAEYLLVDENTINK